jgi:hypothetical protein
LHPGQVVVFTLEKLAQRLTLIGRVIAAADLQTEGSVLEVREEMAGRGEGSGLDELIQWSASSRYLRA